jgi:preprotein translocase subunit SecA
MGVFTKILHAGEGRKLKLVESIAPEVAAFEPEMEARSDEELRAMTGEFRARLAQCDTKEERVEMLDDLLPEASRSCGRLPSGRWANATSTCRSWAAPRCTSAGSPR